MFERFTDSARRVVVQAQQEAQELRHERVGTEHLLLALVREPATPVAGLLAGVGLDHPAVRADVRRLAGGDVDGPALAAIGVDLDAVREAVESAFGEGALERKPATGRRERTRSRFAADARRTLELSLRETVRLKGLEISDGHILLGLLREEQGLGGRVISGRGVDVVRLRQEVEAALA
ncbi:hypothetical protein KNE206_45820 [Kitasatospora sp. NE20-6]|uniref:Clp protease N-terminal domain-containing protein n=1 Tax=Kitasatospora sp. NE20-6 TaxID=2859066 RepID=UPI0034DBBDDE